MKERKGKDSLFGMTPLIAEKVRAVSCVREKRRAAWF